MNGKESIWLKIGKSVASNAIGLLMLLILVTASILLGFSIVALLLGIVFLAGMVIIGLLAIIGMVLIPSVIGLILGSIVWYAVKAGKDE